MIPLRNPLTGKSCSVSVSRVTCVRSCARVIPGAWPLRWFRVLLLLLRPPPWPRLVSRGCPGWCPGRCPGRGPGWCPGRGPPPPTSLSPAGWSYRCLLLLLLSLTSSSSCHRKRSLIWTSKRVAVVRHVVAADCGSRAPCSIFRLWVPTNSLDVCSSRWSDRQISCKVIVLVLDGYSQWQNGK